MKIENKELLKEVSILIYTIAGIDKVMSYEEELIVDKTIKGIFGFSNGEALDIKESIYKDKNLLQKVLKAIDTIKKENNHSLNLIILALISAIAASDEVFTKSEQNVVKIIKEKLLT
jgi:hypothetical protein